MNFKPTLGKALSFATLLAVSLPSGASAASFLNGDFSSAAGWAQDSLTGDANTSGVSGGVGILNSGASPRGIGLSQSVSGFDIGATYTVSVDVRNFAPGFGTNTEKNFGIALDDVLAADFSGEDLGLAALTTTDVGVATHTFVAGAATIEFMFVSQLIDDRSFTIDNARLDFVVGPAPVPLPAAGFLLIGGLAGFATMRRRAT